MVLTRKNQSSLVVLFLGVALALLATVGLSTLADPALTVNTQEILPGQVPDGLAAEEWQSIQSAVAAAEYHFAYHEADATSAMPYFWAPNRAQGWQTVFTPQGVQVTPRGEEAWNWGLTLTSYGHGTERIQVQRSPGLSAEQATLTYSWDDNLTEWWINSAAGLEQGFTVQERPKPANGEPLILEMGVIGDLIPVQQGEVIAFTEGTGMAILTYDKLYVTDAEGQTLPASLVLVTHGADATQNTIQIQVDDTLAVYPLTIDPWVEGAKLTASDAVAGDRFGYYVAIDGDTVVISAQRAGSAYVFVKSAEGWTAATETAKLTPSDGDPYGGYVAVSGDVIALAAPANDMQKGAVYMFEKPAGGWTTASETAKIVASDAFNGMGFGGSIALSDDTLFVGVPGYGSPELGSDVGAVYIFEKPVGGWTAVTEIGKLTASDGVRGDEFGRPVALDGSTIVVGTDEADSDKGAVYAFVKPAGGWATATETAKLITSDGAARSGFGSTLAISGNTVVAGAGRSNANKGTVYVFVEPPGGWVAATAPVTETATLTGSDTAGGGFDEGSRLGLAVAMSGNVVVAGAPGDVDNGFFSGAAYVFVKPTGGWASATAPITETMKLKPSDGASLDGFGRPLAMSGGTIVAASYGDESNTGAFYIFNAQDTDQDGIDSAIEDNVPTPGGGTGDGNGDGIPDRDQANVSSFPNAMDGGYLTLAADTGVVLANVQVTQPVTTELPVGVTLPQGLLSFQVPGLSAGGTLSVTLVLHAGDLPNTYWKYGPTADNNSDHWYNFAYDGETGAVINGNQIILHFVDGKRGDFDLAANGSISDPGGPAATQYRLYLPNAVSPPPPATSSATLAQPPTMGNMGLLAGLLFVGFAMGTAVLVWGDPEWEESGKVGRKEEDDLAS